MRRARSQTYQRSAGFSGEGPQLGEALFDAILKNRSGVSIDPYEET